ncbi:hypothetical protein ZHAS_00016194 [Anopheles sinensis]|uniref:Uncharacterized protein n=1 Tax=Anopheles sinensis TaxID=74873 RepID=A0A084WD38_ANOSI|nr:hypothetical protein ZHAS_00016194 [Anopheles sinensis]
MCKVSPVRCTLKWLESIFTCQAPPATTTGYLALTCHFTGGSRSDRNSSAQRHYHPQLGDILRILSPSDRDPLALVT